MKWRLAAVVPMALALAAGALGDEAPGIDLFPAPALVTSELLADTTAIAPGQPFFVAVTLTAPANFHIYWSNPGDSGIATSFDWTLPAGYKAEPLDFPIPSTFAQSGGITGYGYSGTTTFLFKITPPREINATVKDASVGVNAHWLCCNKEKCVPGSKKLALALPIGQPREANAARFADARRELPAAAPPGDLFALAVPFAGQGAEEYGLQIGWAKAPASVEAYPPNVDGLQLTLGAVATVPGQPRRGPLMAVNRMLAASTLIDMKAHTLVGQKVAARTLPVLIVYTAAGDSTRNGFYVNVDASALGVKAGP